MLTSITGIGPKTEILLQKINIYNITDLITYYPYRYQIYQIIDLNTAQNNDQVVVSGVIESDAKVAYIKRNFNRLTFRVVVNNMLINIVIFNRAFIKNQLTVNRRITIIGKYNKLKNEIVASNIKFERIDELKIESIYHLINGLNNSNLNKMVNNALKSSTFVDDFIPKHLNEKYNLITKDKALNFIHNPQDFNEIKIAKLKLIYEELFVFMFKINFLKQKRKHLISKIVRNIERQDIDKFIKLLPFKLTDDQNNATKEIIDDLLSDNIMNRLLLGDVGSGKTVVVLNTIYANFLSGYQSALLAPTEILANQHFNNIKELAKNTNMKIALLTGSIPKKEKEIITNDLKLGNIDLIIGTHAILQDNVKFNNIGLVVTDEQHRFGVKQRENLRNKGQMCDVLYMSATPIPRTYALTLYGDMDITMIKSKPKNRKDIITKIFTESNLKDVLSKMLEEIKKGRQVFVVAPLIENDEESDLTNVIELKNKLDVAFNSKIPIDIIHGKLKGKEKDNIMSRFKNNETKILISTTVIEVGIDIENATMMVIFDAHQFGLATIHQLRGRVGRNDFDSYCYLITNKDTERLKVLEESNDGFYISQKDLELRGAGDMFGTDQSGDMVFKIANLKDNYKVLLQAQKDSEEYIKTTEYLNNELYVKIVKNISNND